MKLPPLYVVMHAMTANAQTRSQGLTARQSRLASAQSDMRKRWAKHRTRRLNTCNRARREHRYPPEPSGSDLYLAAEFAEYAAFICEKPFETIRQRLFSIVAELRRLAQRGLK
jgi:hypothetical protein